MKNWWYKKDGFKFDVVVYVIFKMLLLRKI